MSTIPSSSYCAQSLPGLRVGRRGGLARGGGGEAAPPLHEADWRSRPRWRRYHAFQDERNLYMLLEYIIGGKQRRPKK